VWAKRVGDNPFVHADIANSYVGEQFTGTLGTGPLTGAHSTL
jgi:hypothetical protein